jgi:TRAP-type C4-dicarboxylate transport system permease small subunit
MKTLEKITRVLNGVFAAVSGCAIVGLTALAAVNMVSRAVFKPVTGSYELIGFLGAVAVACGLGYTQIAKGHIVVNILTDKFSPTLNKVLDAANHIVGAAFWGLVSWQTVTWGTQIARSGELSQTLQIPYFPIVYLAAAGLGVFSLTLFIDFILIFAPKPQGEESV